MAEAGPELEVVLEACYGWYLAAYVLADAGPGSTWPVPWATTGGHQRVKNDERDATDLIDLLRMGRLAEA